MDRKKHLIDCGAFLVMFLYGNAKLYAATKDINVGLSAGPLAATIMPLFFYDRPLESITSPRYRSAQPFFYYRNIVCRLLPKYCHRRLF